MYLIKKNKGITIIELLVVMAVIVSVMAVVLPQFSRMRQNQSLNNSVSDVASSLNKARSQTLSSLDSSEYGVHLQEDSVIIFKGMVYSAQASDNEIIPLLSPASITNVTLGGVSSTSGDMYFERLTGDPSDSGTITISSGDYSKTVTISVTGIVSSN